MASDGDPRVHLLLNLVLSSLFVAVVLWGLDLIGAVDWTLPRLVVGALALVLLTHVVTR